MAAINKVLLVTTTFSPDIGGVETMLTNLCQHFLQEKIPVDIISYTPLIVRQKAPLREVINSYVTIHRIPWIGFGLFNILEHFFILQFFYLVPVLAIYTFFFLLFNNYRQFKIIHCFGLAGAFAGGLSSRLFNIPSILDVCTVYRFPKRPMLSLFVKNIFNLCDYIRGNSPIGKEEILNLGINSAKVGVITPPVDEKYFKPLSKIKTRRYLKLPIKSFIVLFVGRMVKSKNVDLALNSIKYIKHQDISFIFIGEGPLQNLVESAAVKDSRIIYKGNVLHNDLLFYYNSADILTCASVDTKLVSFVGRESLMCGLPILFPDTATYFGISYKVDSHLIPPDCGSIFDSNPRSLASIINKLYTKAKVFNSTSCRQYALSNFSNQSMKWIGDSYQLAIHNSQKL